MAALSSEQIATLLRPFLPLQTLGRDAPEASLTPQLLEQLSTYLDLLLHWNSRINLTAIRSPEEIVQRHFGESLFAGFHLAGRLPAEAHLLDYGSGAGFPGLPIQLLLPSLHVTLAESQAKKTSFLREVICKLSLQTEVWPQRVEAMPTERIFDAVTLRAVERMETSLQEAATRVRPEGWIVVLAGKGLDLPSNTEEYALPESQHRRLILHKKH